MRMTVSLPRLLRQHRIPGLLHIIEHPRHGLIGCIGFHEEPGGLWPEFGYWIAREHWGQGYATEAARPVLDHAFETLNLPRVVANIFAGNDASIKVAEKLGMRFLSDEVSDGLPCKDYGITQEERQKMLAV